MFDVHLMFAFDACIWLFDEDLTFDTHLMHAFGCLMMI